MTRQSVTFASFFSSFFPLSDSLERKARESNNAEALGSLSSFTKKYNIVATHFRYPSPINNHSRNFQKQAYDSTIVKTFSGGYQSI